MATAPAPGRDRITLRLPAEPSYGSIARTAAMTLGLRAGFPWPALERLALAVDETMILLFTCGGHSGTLVLVFHVGGGELTIDAHLDDPGREGPAPGADDALARFEELVAGTVSGWWVDPSRPAVHLRVTSEPREPPEER